MMEEKRLKMVPEFKIRFKEPENHTNIPLTCFFYMHGVVMATGMTIVHIPHPVCDEIIE